MTEADFTRLSVYATAYLDELTMGRTAGTLPEETEERAKKALCAVTDAYKLNEQGGGVASETNDGISVTYIAGISNSKTDGRRLYEAAALFLGPTGLLYRGVR
jgi:hypothetical protein